MSDEQTIYISPEDDLTTVRERLEQLQTRKVTLVIPAHTQLRSHVAWKLLYARARELGKDVLIVSSDPQVRSVAHAVKFNVAHSLESSQQGRSRPTAPARPARSVPTNRPRSTNLSQRSTSTRTNTTRSTNNLRPRPQEIRSWQGSSAEANKEADQREQHGYQDADAHIDEVPDNRLASTFQLPEQDYSTRSYDYQINATPPIRPLSSDQIEDPDLLFEDYNQARVIRQAAEEKPEPSKQQPAPPATPRITSEKKSRTPRSHAPYEPLDVDEEDPFTYMEDKQFSASIEQHGNALLDEDDHYEHVIQDVADAPTSIIGQHTIYGDDQDELNSPAPAPRTGRGNNKNASYPDPDTARARKRENTQTKSQRPASRRSGQIGPRSASTISPISRLRQEDLDDADLLPVEDRPTRVQQHNEIIEEQPSRSNRRDPEAVPLAWSGQNRPNPRHSPTQRPTAQVQTGAGSRGTGSLRPSTATLRGERASQDLRQRKPTPLPVKRNAGQKRSRRGMWIALVIIVCLLIGLVFGIYAIPQTTVKLTFSTRNYTHPVSLTASPNAQAGTVPAQLVEHTFSQTGNGKATGSREVGTAKALGEVCFSNASNIVVTVPTGSIVTAAGGNGTQFITTAEVSLDKQSSCANNPPVPVQAVNPGESGNLLAQSVTVVPPSTLDTIAKYNNTTAAQLKLTVRNNAPMSGGGMQPVPAITANDLTNVKTALQGQLKNAITAWTKSLPQDGVYGNLNTTDTLINTPAVNSTITTGQTFPAELQVKATLIYVKNSTIQQAAKTQLNTALKLDKAFANDVILNDTPQPITITKLKQTNTVANILKLDFTATAHTAGTFDPDKIKSEIIGHSPADAQHILETQIVGLKQVNIHPDFFPWVSWNKDNITITVVSDTAIATR
ncbi:hypothetical protein [Dictyobacter arantiisoli]|uniref:Baseplate protein J-like barrel domain-containing protein n=1 Tax=Dictyobacter arantiisoli TaxID=2014874 RepID=A0A5A5T7R0_9CHLR|nr:hypothetical protein [Dictyobacter arantiisoli]GCF07447.1 hypothetical protein KDI_10110 [Dictyobacter arantiisoli]